MPHIFNFSVWLLMGIAALASLGCATTYDRASRCPDRRGQSRGKLVCDSGDVTIANESHDLRGHLPLLISAAMDFIARSTAGEITFGMRSDDEAIQFVQRGM